MSNHNITRKRLTHAVEKIHGGSTWEFGRALCQRPIGRYTPVSDDPEEVTCVGCKKRLIEKLKVERALERGRELLKR